MKEIRRDFDGVVILSGAMSSGGDILAAQAMGADLAYIGTRFIATREANASDEYKQMIVSSKSADIVYTPVFTGVHGSYLKGSILPIRDLVLRIEAEYEAARARIAGDWRQSS